MSFIPQLLQQQRSTIKKQTFDQKTPSLVWNITREILDDVVITIVDDTEKELVEKPSPSLPGDYLVTLTSSMIIITHNVARIGRCEILSKGNNTNTTTTSIVSNNITNIGNDRVMIIVPKKISTALLSYSTLSGTFEASINILDTSYDILINNQISTICEIPTSLIELAQDDTLFINNINNIKALYIINNTKKEILNGHQLKLLARNTKVIVENNNFYVENIEYISPFIQYI